MYVVLDGDGPLYRQLTRSLKAAIVAGRAAPGSRLPSTRTLAGELRVSRNTVLLAFDQLLAEGMLESRGAAGTFVAARSGRPAPRRAAEAGRGGGRSSAARRRLPRPPEPARPGAGPAPPAPRYDFRYGDPPIEDLPLAAWGRIVGRRLRSVTRRQLGYGFPGGALELRSALADYLGRARGVACDPDRIVIVNGSQQAIDLTVRLLVARGDRVIVEDPQYQGLRWSLDAAGARLVPVPVDDAGIRVERLEGIRDARLACVTPSHQFPSGAVLSFARRRALLAWADLRGAFLLEDDYDGEYRYEQRPIDCLKSLDRNDRVVYVGTASKIFAPSLRLGWIVAPASLVDDLVTLKELSDRSSAGLEQLAFADFIREGQLERHVRRARRRLARRRLALLEALDEAFGDLAVVRGAAAGIHVLVCLPTLPNAAAPRLVERCRNDGVGVYSAAPYYRRKPREARLLLGYAPLQEDEIREGVRRMRSAFDAVASGTGG